VGIGLDDGFGAGFGIAALENAGADENSFSAEFANERGIGGRGDASGGKIGNGELAGLGDFANEIERSAEFLGFPS